MREHNVAVTLPFPTWSLLLAMASQAALDFEERTLDLPRLADERTERFAAVERLRSALKSS